MLSCKFNLESEWHKPKDNQEAYGAIIQQVKLKNKMYKANGQIHPKNYLLTPFHRVQAITIH